MDNEKIDDKERRCEKLRRKYSRIKDGGISLYISATPDEVANLCVQEEMSYMPDYIYDENGSLIQIMFDKIDKK